MFERDCGATTDFSTQVSILGFKESLPDKAGNIFIADSNHGAVTNLKVGIRWSSPRQLVISYSPQARVFRKQNSAGDVAIVYESN